MPDGFDIPDDNADQPTPGIHPALEAFRQLPWQEGAPQDWADNVSTIVNDHIQKTQVAEANRQAGDALVNNIARFGGGLANWVRQDPHAVHSALDLVPETIGSLISANPDHPDEDREATHNALVGDIQRQIAMAAVQRMAELHAPSARGMLADPRIADLLDDRDKGGLDSYIGLQDMARGADTAAQQGQAQYLAAQQAATAALGHMGRLFDPRSDSVRFPPGWATGLIANNSIMPADKAALMHLYGRLQTQGDAPATDALTFHRMVDGIAAGQPPSHADLLNAAGTALRFADAVHLGPGAVPMDPRQRGYFANLSDTLGQARSALMGRDGENGVAGTLAFNRFVNWMMPALRAGGASLDGAQPNHALLALPRFGPSGDDVAPRAQEGRRSLAEIFSGAAR